MSKHLKIKINHPDTSQLDAIIDTVTRVKRNGDGQVKWDVDNGNEFIRAWFINEPKSLTVYYPNPQGAFIQITLSLDELRRVIKEAEEIPTEEFTDVYHF